MNGKIRWVKPGDLNVVLAIEAACCQKPLDEKTLRAFVRTDCNVCLVYLDRPTKAVQGFIRYRVEPRHFEVLAVCVHPDHRRQGVGKALLQDAHGRLKDAQCNRLSFNVPEDNLDAHLWLKALNFDAVGVVQAADDGPDFYRFVKRLLPQPSLLEVTT